MTQEELDQRNLVTYAKRIAAKATKTDEPFGQNLPEEVWSRHLEEAKRWLQFVVTDRSSGYGHTTVTGTCPADATAKEVAAIFHHYYFGGRGEWAHGGKFGCTIHTD